MIYALAIRLNTTPSEIRQLPLDDFQYLIAEIEIEAVEQRAQSHA